MPGSAVSPGSIEWMGFTEVRQDLQRKKDRSSQWLSDPSCMSAYHDDAQRQWCLLSKRYDEVSWGGLWDTHHKRIRPGPPQNMEDVNLDARFKDEPYTKELYENVCHVLGQGAMWRLNTGCGVFRFRLHLLDWWHGGDRRYVIAFFQEGATDRHLIWTPVNGDARIDEFILNVKYPSKTIDVHIIRDDDLPGDSFPCLAGFDIQRLGDHDCGALDESQKIASRTRKAIRSSSRGAAQCMSHVNQLPEGLCRRVRSSSRSGLGIQGQQRAVRSSSRKSRHGLSAEGSLHISMEVNHTECGSDTQVSHELSTSEDRSNPAEEAQRSAHPTLLEAKPRSSSLKLHKPLRKRTSTRSTTRRQLQDVSSSGPSSSWQLTLGAAPEGLLNHPEDPNDTSIFQCINRSVPDGRDQLVGLLVAPEVPLKGLVLTCPGAGGGQGPADPLGSGGGGTYGAYNVYGRLAAELPKKGLAVILLHYPDGQPGRPLQGGIDSTIHHTCSLIRWFQVHSGVLQLPVALVGWSMGGPVVIDAAAKILGMRHDENANVKVRGVATIASMKEVSREAPQKLISSNVELLLMHNTNEKCKGSNSTHIAKLAGDGVKPILFPGEDHGVRSAHKHLLPWLQNLFEQRAQAFVALAAEAV